MSTSAWRRSFGIAAAQFTTCDSAAKARQKLIRATSTNSDGIVLANLINRESGRGTICLRRVGSTFSYNAFAPLFVGTFEDYYSGSRLSGEFRLSRLTQYFIGLCWLIWFLWMGSVLLLPWIGPGGADSAVDVEPMQRLLLSVPWLGFGLLFGLTMYLFVGFGKWLGRNDVDAIRRHIENSLAPVCSAPNAPR